MLDKLKAEYAEIQKKLGGGFSTNPAITSGLRRRHRADRLRSLVLPHGGFF